MLSQPRDRRVLTPLRLHQFAAQLEDLLLQLLIAQVKHIIFSECLRGRRPSHLQSLLAPQGGAGAAAPVGVSAAGAALRGARPLGRQLRALRRNPVL